MTRQTAAWTAALLVVAGCGSREESVVPRAGGSTTSGVTATPSDTASDTEPVVTLAAPAPMFPGAPIADAIPAGADAPEVPAADPRARWLAAPFRCRAISTTRLRSCRMEQRGADVSITFPVADLRCERVVFDAAGDPERLERCRSDWLRVPETIALEHAAASDTWSGSHSGWRWRDGETYCCPGVWMVAPAAEDVAALDPIDADHDVPPPKPPRDRRTGRRSVLPG